MEKDILMGLKVVIIEDEKPAARRLTRMLSELNIDVLRALHSVEESVEWLQNNDHPDLIFLDIQLSPACQVCICLNGYRNLHIFLRVRSD